MLREHVWKFFAKTTSTHLQSSHWYAAHSGKGPNAGALDQRVASPHGTGKAEAKCHLNRVPPFAPNFAKSALRGIVALSIQWRTFDVCVCVSLSLSLSLSISRSRSRSLSISLSLYLSLALSLSRETRLAATCPATRMSRPSLRFSDEGQQLPRLQAKWIDAKPFSRQQL